MNSIVRRMGSLALGLQCVVALAQDDDGATRVQRAADNPLRLIIEAGKLKPRTKGDDADAATRPTVEAKAAATPRPAPARPAPQVGTLPDVLVPDVAPVDAATPAPVAAIAFVPPPYNPDDYFGVAPPVKDAAAAPARAAPVARPASAASAPAVTQAPPRAPQIVGYVAPVLPDRVRRRLQGDGEVVLDFVVNPDGSVSNVAIRSATDKALESAALDAVRQWRYEPIATAQAHGAQLVFKLGE